MGYGGLVLEKDCLQSNRYTNGERKDGDGGHCGRTQLRIQRQMAHRLPRRLRFTRGTGVFDGNV